MREVREEISKETYERYMSMDRSAVSDEIEKSIPIQWACGYGWYGYMLVKDNGKYYIEHTIGSSCD